MKRFLKLFIFTFVFISALAFFQSKIHAWYITVLIIDYVYEDGTTAAPRYVKAVNEGDTFNVESPYVKGYEPDRDVISGTVYWSGEAKAIVTYYPVALLEYELRINYLDESDNILTDPYINTFEANYEYNIESPTIKGYSTKDLNVKGSLEEDTTINVIYEKNKYTLKID